MNNWISIAESKPNSNCGILLKIIPKQEHRTHDVKGRIYYGFFWPCEYVYITGFIEKDGTVSSSAWKATKEFDLDEIYWFTSIGFGS